jgi:tryptophan-rich sensory protein
MPGGDLKMASQSMTPGGTKGLIAAISSIAIALAAGGLGGLATASSVSTWYAGLNKPAFNPPNAVFGPVWTTLYVLMAVAAWRVWRAGPDGGRRPALTVYAVQLTLNLAWSFIFFGLRQPGFALGEVVLLLASVVVTGVLFWRVDRPAGLMMIPYAAWVSFASLLNFEIWRLN